MTGLHGRYFIYIFHLDKNDNGNYNAVSNIRSFPHVKVEWKLLSTTKLLYQMKRF
jgi:hypothetical protein